MAKLATLLPVSIQVGDLQGKFGRPKTGMTNSSAASLEGMLPRPLPKTEVLPTHYSHFSKTPIIRASYPMGATLLFLGMRTVGGAPHGVVLGARRPGHWSGNV
jgi:hypothetical protein